jgi:hypothetical protein
MLIVTRLPSWRASAGSCRQIRFFGFCLFHWQGEDKNSQWLLDFFSLISGFAQNLSKKILIIIKWFAKSSLLCRLFGFLNN